MIAADCPSTSIHGTHTAYTDHRCRCPQARAAVAYYELIRQREVRANGGPGRLVPSVGTTRRLQALHAVGWPAWDLAPRLGVVIGVETSWARGDRQITQRRVAERISAVYLELHERPGPSLAAQTRALNKGWVPPLRWVGKDMDDPLETPWRLGREPDWAAVERLVAGEMAWRERPKIERRLAVEILRSRGMSVNAIGRRLEATADPDANAQRMVQRDLVWLRERGLLAERAS